MSESAGGQKQIKMIMMDEGNIDPEKAFVALGKYGKYQMRAWLIANIPSLYMAMQMLSMAFVNGKPKFQCFLLTDLQDLPSNITMSFNDTCQVLQQSSPDDQTTTYLPCGSTNGTGFAYDYQDFGQTIVTEWDLVCRKSFHSQFVGSIFMFGVMVGAMTITQISDKFGRRWTFLICNWLYGLVGLAGAFANGYVLFAFVRFLSGILTAGVGMVAFVISCESVPTSLRAYSTLLGCVTWCVGYTMLGVAAMFVRDWRRLTMIAALPAFISVGYHCFLPETLRWLVVNGRREQAEKWVMDAAKCNRVTVRIEELLTKKEDEDEADEAEDQASEPNIKRFKKSNVFHIFTKSKVLAVQATVLCYVWLVNAFVYYGLSLYSTQLIGDKYTNFILSGLVELPGYFTAAFTMEKFGRRNTVVAFHVLAGVSLLALAFVPPQTGTGVNLLPLITTLSLIGKFAISCTFQAIFLFTAELYPTSVRTVGSGLSSTTARIGAILAPIIATADGLKAWIPPALFGIMSLLAALLAGCLPETKGVELPNDIHQAQPGPMQKLLCGGQSNNESSSLSKSDYSKSAAMEDKLLTIN